MTILSIFSIKPPNKHNNNKTNLSFSCVSVVVIVVNKFLYLLEPTLKRCWKNLRDGFVKCLKKREVLTRSGAGKTKLPTCKFFDQLHFIRDTIIHRSTESNFNPVIETFDDEVLEQEHDLSISDMASPVSSVKTPEVDRPKHKRQRKNEVIEEVAPTTYEAALVEKLSKKTSADAHFLLSLEPILNRLSPKLNQKAKLNMQQILFEIEFGEQS